MNENASKSLFCFLLVLLIHSGVLIERSDFSLSSLFPSSSPSRYSKRIKSEPRFRSPSRFDSDEELDKFLINLDRKENRGRSLLEKNDRFLFPHRPRPLFLPFINDPFPIKPVLSFVKHKNDKLFIVMEDEAKCAKNNTEEPGNKNPLTNTVETPQSIKQTEESQYKPQPSSCVWAIIACCSPTNYHFSPGCFHYLGCSIAFWQVDPCHLSIILMASREAVEFYEQFEVSSTESPRPTSPTSGNVPTSTITVPSTSVTQEGTEKTTTANPTSEEPTTEKPATETAT